MSETFVDTSCTGAYLGGLVLRAVSKQWTDPATGKSITRCWLRLLCRDEDGEEATCRLVLPATVDPSQFVVGKTFVFPVREITTTDGARCFLLRADAPVLPARPGG